MKQRNRSRARNVTMGTRILISDPSNPAHAVVKEYEESMMDFTGKKKDPSTGLLPPSDMDHTRIWRTPCLLSGDSSAWRFTGMPMALNTPGTTGWPIRGGYTRGLENQDLTLKFLANTHPFRAEFSVPTAIAELLDIGSLFRFAAKSFFELAGNTYLNYRFGWVQFVRDIKTLSTITRSIESRIKEFDSLAKHGGTRRHAVMLHTSGSAAGVQTIQSEYGASVDADWRYNYTYRVSLSCRWRWKGNAKVSLSKLEAFNLAVSNVFDLGELDASTIWNTIPWTWLIDYFTDIGSYLQAHENESIVEPYHICVMRRYKAVNAYYPRSPAGSTLRKTNGRCWLQFDSRDVISSVPSLPPFRLALISQSQVYVLLAILGRFRGSKY